MMKAYGKETKREYCHEVNDEELKQAVHDYSYARAYAQATAADTDKHHREEMFSAIREDFKAEKAEYLATRAEALGVDIDDCITLQFGGHGPMAILGASVTSVSDRRAVFHCEDGYIEIENVNNPESIKVYDNENKLLREAKCPTQITGYEYELIETAEAIKEGKLECVSMPHEATIYMMEMMDDIRKQLEVKYPFEENKKN